MSATAPVRVEVGDGDSRRMAIVRAQLEQLFPPVAFPVHVGYGRPPAGYREVDAWRVIPARTAPRLLLPTDVAAARRIVVSHNGLRPRRVAALRRLASWAVGPSAALHGDRTVLRVSVPTAVDDAAVDDAVITRQLRRRVPGAAATALSLRDFHPRAKPTLVLVDAEGEAVAFAKVAADPATAERVLTEADLLRRLGPPLAGPDSAVRLPRLLDSGRCGPFAFSVAQPLPARVRRVRAEDEPAALRALASFALVPQAAGAGEGPPAWSRSRTAALAGTGLWQLVIGRLEAARAARRHRPELVAALDRLAEAAHRKDAEVEVAVGCYHGDWVPWNLGWDPDGDLLWAWDLEYGNPEGPVGLDALRWVFQVNHVARGTSLVEAVDAMRVAGGRVLPQLGVDPAHGGLLIRLHLLETFGTALELLAAGRGLPPGLEPGGVEVMDAAAR